MYYFLITILHFYYFPYTYIQNIPINKILSNIKKEITQFEQNFVETRVAFSLTIQARIAVMLLTNRKKNFSQLKQNVMKVSRAPQLDGRTNGPKPNYTDYI